MDDDRLVREASREAATTLGYRTSTSQSAEQALWLIGSQTIDVVLLDLNLPDTGRLDILREIKHCRPDIEVIVVSGHATVKSAVQAMKTGAYDYITKPFGLQELKLVLERVSVHLQLKSETRRLGERIKCNRGFGKMIGRAPEMDELYRIIAKAAHSVHPVLILGESGDGQALGRARELAKMYLKASEVTRRNTRVHFIQLLKERIVREVGYGLSLEGASVADLVKSMQAKAEPGLQKGRVA